MGRLRLKEKKPSRELGRFIYAYCHIRTNQVLYSLTQSLRSSIAIKQLPDTGANNTPTHIRKDVWKPLFTLAFPDGSRRSLAQGLDAFHKLREWRKLHELNWEPPLALSQPFSDAQIDDIERHLQNRGGSKKESAYDIIKRQKHKIRERMVMNQKANSIADLAAVLLQQEELGSKTQGKMIELQRRQREEHIHRMLWLATLGETDGLERLDAQIAALQSRIASDETLPKRKRNRKLKPELLQLQSMRTMMQASVDAAKSLRSPTRSRAREQVDGQRKAAHRQEQAEQERDLSALQETRAEEAKLPLVEVLYLAGRARLLRRLLAIAEGTEKPQRVAQEIRSFAPGSPEDKEVYHRLREVQKRELELIREVVAAGGDVNAEVDSIRQKLLEYEIELIQDQLPKSGDAEANVLSAEVAVLTRLRDAGNKLTGQTTAVPSWIEELPSFSLPEVDDNSKRGLLHRKRQRSDRPIFSTEGVTIKWNNLLDPEYAAEWPQNVAHEPMGWYRHTAPKVDAPLIADMDEYATVNEKAVKSKDKGPSAERRLIIDRIKSEILDRVMGRESKQEPVDSTQWASEQEAMGLVGEVEEARETRRPKEPESHA